MDIKAFKTQQLENAIESREREIAEYEMNIWNFQHAIDGAPQPSAALVAFLEGREHPGINPPDELAEEYASFTSVDGVAQQKFIEHLRMRIVAERTEMNKSATILAALQAQLASLKD